MSILVTVAVCSLTCAGPAIAAELARQRIPADCIERESGHCFIASLDLGEEGDRATGNQSRLELFEDGKLLGPPRIVHAEIRNQGRGRFSHWTRESLYFSTSDNSDPRTNGRLYEVVSRNPKSTLGGLDRFPSQRKSHVEMITAGKHGYAVPVGGTLDMDNTRTLTSNNCYIGFPNNVSLTIENVGDSPVINPRLVLNDRGNWYTFDSLLQEFTRGAKDDQERAYFIWENMRQNLYHETPLFGDNEPHDPVRLFNVYGFNLCDDAGSAGCSLFHHAGLVGSKNRALNGHVQCEACLNGKHQFLDVDMDCFYLDRDNELPVSGHACARDHDLVRRELNYGPVVDRFTSSDSPAALFGADDRQFDAQLRGHEIAYTLRPSEKVVFRWDNMGKYCAENKERTHRPKYFGNSQFVFEPRRTLAAVKTDSFAAQDVVAASTEPKSDRLAGGSDQAHLDYEIKVPYPSCGGSIQARFLGMTPEDRFSLALSLDGKHWKPLWEEKGAGEHEARVSLDEALDVHNKPAKYRYVVRIGLNSATPQQGAQLCGLVIQTHVLAAPASLPRLMCGANRARYWDQSPDGRRVRVTHEWKESSAVEPLPAIAAPLHPNPGARVRDSIVSFSWPPVGGAEAYHLRVSRRPDFAFPYRPSLDVVIPGTTWSVPYTGIFSPETTYYWRLRCRDRFGVWGAWSDSWTFQWQGPRVPVKLRVEQAGEVIRLCWEPNSRGERPVRYEVYGSDEKGFSIHKEPHDVPGRGRVAGNLLNATSDTSLVVVSPSVTDPNANRVFYRVVAIDGHGTASGCSDFVELPHPFVYSRPAVQATVGQAYRYAVKSLSSLGDYQCRQDPAVTDKRYAYRFWDVERTNFRLVRGPAWLTLDAATGLLTGTPTAADVGTAAIKIEATNQFGGRCERHFQVVVAEPSQSPSGVP